VDVYIRLGNLAQRFPLIVEALAYPSYGRKLVTA